MEFHKDFLTVAENKITIGIRSKPIRGEANKEITKKIARHFGISSSEILVRLGKKSNQKIIEIQNQRI